MSQPLIRPKDIDTLPFLDATKKEQYKNGLTQLWAQYERNPQGSQPRQEAETKIRNASAKLMAEMANYRNARPTSGGGPSQQPARPPTQGAMPGLAQQQAVAPVQGAQMQQQQQQNNGQAQTQSAATMTPWVKQQLSTITVHIPPNCPPHNAAAYKQRWYQTAAQELRSSTSRVTPWDASEVEEKTEVVADTCPRSPLTVTSMPPELPDTSPGTAQL